MQLEQYLEKLLSKLEKDNKVNKNWNISRETGVYLYKLITKNKPKVIVEVGASNGYSTIWLCLAAKKINAEVISFEYVPDKIKRLVENVQKARLVNYFTLIPDDANKRLDKIGRKIDFLFLDSRKCDYLKQLKLAEPFLSKKSIVAADNVISHAKEVKGFLDYVRQSKKYKSELINIGTGLEICKISKK